MRLGRSISHLRVCTGALADILIQIFLEDNKTKQVQRVEKTLR